MANQKTMLTPEEFENFDLDELVRLVEARDAAKKLRRERPWVYDIIRVLWGTRPWIPMDQLCETLWQIRNPSGLPMPKKFRETVQSSLNQHTSQSSVFANKNCSEDDDLFFSPKGKGSGTWALRSKERAIAWLNLRKLKAV